MEGGCHAFAGIGTLGYNALFAVAEGSNLS
jgi:hypothetical protein